MTRKHLLIAAVCLLIACWNSVGFHQGDEHYQLLEFAAWKLGLQAESTLTWEFAERMRPATQPAIVYVAHRIAGLFGEVNPYRFAFLTRLLSAAGFVLLAYRLWRRYAAALPDSKLTRWLALGLLFNWCSVYAGIRFSSEHWSGMAMAAGLLLYPISPPTNADEFRFTPGRMTLRRATIGNTAGHWPAFGAGLLFGLAFLFRYQVAIMVVGFGAWLLFVARERRQLIGLVVIGGLVSVALGTLIDNWFYGEWTFAPWHYLRSNLIEGKAATFGTAPWWDYFRMVFERGVPPLSLLYIVAPLWFAVRYRRDPLTWMMVPFLLVHFALSRKDARFLFPLLPYVPIMILALAAELRKYFGTNLYERPWVRRGVYLLWSINLLLLATVLVRPMISEVMVNKFVYDTYQTEDITLLADNKHIYTYANLILTFYQRPGQVTIHHTKRREDWPDCTTPVCLYSQQSREATPPAGYELVYGTRPGWFDRVGFVQKWADGEKWWRVYERK